MNEMFQFYAAIQSERYYEPNAIIESRNNTLIAQLPCSIMDLRLKLVSTGILRTPMKPLCLRRTTVPSKFRSSVKQKSANISVNSLAVRTALRTQIWLPT